MSTRQIVISAILATPFIACLAMYVGLVKDGSLPPPDLDAIARSIGLGTVTAAQIALVVAAGVMVLMAMVAPIIFAIRANDLPTILISLAMTGSAILMLSVSRTGDGPN